MIDAVYSIYSQDLRVRELGLRQCELFQTPELFDCELASEFLNDQADPRLQLFFLQSFIKIVKTRWDELDPAKKEFIKSMLPSVSSHERFAELAANIAVKSLSFDETLGWIDFSGSIVLAEFAELCPEEFSTKLLVRAKEIPDVHLFFCLAKRFPDLIDEDVVCYMFSNLWTDNSDAYEFFLLCSPELGSAIMNSFKEIRECTEMAVYFVIEYIPFISIEDVYCVLNAAFISRDTALCALESASQLVNNGDDYELRRSLVFNIIEMLPNESVAIHIAYKLVDNQLVDEIISVASIGNSPQFSAVVSIISHMIKMRQCWIDVTELMEQLVNVYGSFSNGLRAKVTRFFIRAIPFFDASHANSFFRRSLSCGTFPLRFFDAFSSSITITREEIESYDETSPEFCTLYSIMHKLGIHSDIVETRMYSFIQNNIKSPFTLQLLANCITDDQIIHINSILQDDSAIQSLNVLSAIIQSRPIEPIISSLTPPPFINEYSVHWLKKLFIPSISRLNNPSLASDLSHRVVLHFSTAQNNPLGFKIIAALTGLIPYLNDETITFIVRICIETNDYKTYTACIDSLFNAPLDTLILCLPILSTVRGPQSITRLSELVYSFYKSNESSIEKIFPHTYRSLQSRLSTLTTEKSIKRVLRVYLCQK